MRAKNTAPRLDPGTSRRWLSVVLELGLLLGIAPSQPCVAAPGTQAQCNASTMAIKGLADSVISRGVAGDRLAARQAFFFLTHYEISSRICETASSNGFSNPDHMARFNAQFVALAAKAAGSPKEAPPEWRDATETCSSAGAPFGLADVERCANAMLKAHLEADMPRVFNTVGCGTRHDWDVVFDAAIVPAITEAAKYLSTTVGDAQLAAAPFVSNLAAAWVRGYRDRIRAQADCK